jgi:HK97 family phage portal protein
LFKRALFGITGAQELIPPRSSAGAGTVRVTEDSAMRHSAVWACLRLRADLESTMPIDVFRRVGEIQVEMPKPPILVNPGGERVDICEWMYSSRVDLDRAGNAFGLITERNAAGLPSRIDLQPMTDCTVKMKGNEITKYRICGKEYDPDLVWHEKQFTVAGFPLGLSPVAYAAWSIGQYQSAQKFALDWFGTGGVPKGHLKNTELATLDPENAAVIKTRYKASVENNDVFVSGKDWEYKPFQAEAVGAEWLEAQKFGIGDIARFFGCPGDLIDAAVSTGSITYANITQRNLQFLIMNLGPAIIRRERALSKLLPAPRYVKLNTSALLRMDDQTRAQLIKTKIDSRTLTPSEARELDNLPPLTPEQIAEFEQLFGKKNPAPVTQEPRSKAEIAAELQRLWLEYQVQELSGEPKEVLP